MQISRIDNVNRNHRPIIQKNYQQNSINFERRILRRIPSVKEVNSKMAREDLINYLVFCFNADTKELNIGNDIAKNNLLLKLAQKIKNNKISKATNPERIELFKTASEFVNAENKGIELLLEDSNFTTEDFIKVAGLVNKDGNGKLAEKLLLLKKPNGYKIDMSKKLHEILTSVPTEKLNKNFNKFKSYIILNVEQDNFVENLNRELHAANISFNPKKLDKLIDVKKIQANSVILSKMDDKILENGNIDAIKFFDKSYSAQVLNLKDSLTKEDYKFFEYFITSSNIDNVDTRINILNKNIKPHNIEEPFSNIKKLFERIDKDKNLRNVFDKMYEKNVNWNKLSFNELMFYVDKFGSKNIADNIDNFINIVDISKIKYNPDEITDILEKNLKNKYYITPEKIKDLKESQRFSGRFEQIKGKIKLFVKFNVLSKLAGTPEPVKKLNNVKFGDYNFADKVADIVNTKAAEKTSSAIANNIKALEKPHVIDNKVIVREYKSIDPNISAKKLKLFNEAQEIVKTRMKSQQQIAEQARDYSLTATKMRNKYLNELFDYVSDVRKSENKKGIKKHSVSNYDVLELYQKIKGYNEKDFRKMLRAKTETGERVYSFDEINKMLDDSIIEHFRQLREQQNAAKEARRLKRMNLKTQNN